MSNASVCLVGEACLHACMQVHMHGAPIPQTTEARAPCRGVCTPQTPTNMHPACTCTARPRIYSCLFCQLLRKERQRERRQPVLSVAACVCCCSVNVESGVDAFVAVQRVSDLEDGTPLSQGSAEWWTDGLNSPAVYIKHTRVALRARELGCSLSSREGSMQPAATQPQEHKAVTADLVGRNLCVLRVDLESLTPQPFSLQVTGRSSEAVVIVTLASGAPMRGLLQHNFSDHFRVDVDDKLLQTDFDAALRVSLEGRYCSPSLSVRWPDGDVKVWNYPDSRDVLIERSKKPWTPGFFLLLVSPPTNTRCLCSFCCCCCIAAEEAAFLGPPSPCCFVGGLGVRG